MGKQKSFIIVGSTFLGVILLIILVSLITKGIKETKCLFEAEVYAMEVGKSKALAPTLYAGGVVEDVEFTYSADTEGVIEILEGTYSSGSASVYCWVFSEPDASGNIKDKESYIPHDENDVISIKDGYWYINDTKTVCKAESNYEGEDLMAYATRSIEPRSVKCYILNGVQTDIPYEDGVTPERNASTGTWFIKGKDTGYTYKGIQATIIGKKVGSTKITAKGIIDGKEIVATTTIQVCLPNPASIALSYIDNTLVTNLNKEVAIDGYEVKAKSSSLVAPKQDVEFRVVNGTEAIALNGNVVKVSETGTYRVRLTALKSSFTEGIGKYESISATVTVIVLDTTDEQIKLIEAARVAIESIGTVSDTPEIRELVLAAREAVNKVLEENISAITNIETLEKAEKRLGL